MEKRARWVLVITAVSLCGMLWWHSTCRAPDPVKVQTVSVTVRDIYNSITMSGEIQAANSTTLCPAENATVAEVYAVAGETVEQGDVLCTLTPDSAGSASLSEGLQAVQAALIGGQAQAMQAQEGRVLRAPVSGTLLSVPAAGDAVYAGVPCVRIADLDALQVRAACPELYAGQLASGQRANVTVPALTNTTFGAKLQDVSPVAVRAVSLTGTSSDATVQAMFCFSGETEGLRPGYSATVKVFTDRHDDAMSLPLEAVCQRGDKEYVFCVEDGHAVQYPVETGYLLEQTIEIVDGISPNAVVILSPPETLLDGAAVEVVA